MFRVVGEGRGGVVGSGYDLGVWQDALGGGVVRSMSECRLAYSRMEKKRYPANYKSSIIQQTILEVRNTEVKPLSISISMFEN